MDDFKTLLISKINHGLIITIRRFDNRNSIDKTLLKEIYSQLDQENKILIQTVQGQLPKIIEQELMIYQTTFAQPEMKD